MKLLSINNRPLAQYRDNVESIFRIVHMYHADTWTISIDSAQLSCDKPAANGSRGTTMSRAASEASSAGGDQAAALAVATSTGAPKFPTM